MATSNWYFDCPRCGGGGAANSSPTSHWLLRILNHKTDTPSTGSGAEKRSASNQEPSYTTHQPQIRRRCPSCLPTPRPRALTLDSSPHRPNVAETSTTILQTASQSSSLFFSRLPVELRIVIYGLLFSNRTLHIQKKYTYCNIRGAKRNQLRLTTDKHDDERKDWYLWQCTSHRNSRRERWLDCCREESDRGNFEIDYRWLLTCRQGYSEAIAVLYGTNRFHFKEDAIRTFDSLPLTFLPQRLATITAVDINWPEPSSQYSVRCFMVPYANIWSRIALLTSLRSLRLNLIMRTDSSDRLPTDASEKQRLVAEKKWLGPPDELVRRLGSQLEEFTFMASSNFYSMLQKLRNEEEVLSGYCTDLKCFTRAIGDHDYVINELPDDFAMMRRASYMTWDA